MTRDNMTFEEDVIDRLARIETSAIGAAENHTEVKADLIDYGLRITSLETFRWKAAGCIGLAIFVLGALQGVELLFKIKF